MYESYYSLEYDDEHHEDLRSFPTRRSSDLSLSFCHLHSTCAWMYRCTVRVGILFTCWQAWTIRVSRRKLPSPPLDRKSTRLNSSHVRISYAVFCLKKIGSRDTALQEDVRILLLARVRRRAPRRSTLFPYTTLFRSVTQLLPLTLNVCLDVPLHCTCRDTLHLLAGMDYQSQPSQVTITTIRSEEHTSELQSRPHLVCRLLLEKNRITRYGPSGRCTNPITRSSTTTSTTKIYALSLHDALPICHSASATYTQRVLGCTAALYVSGYSSLAGRHGLSESAVASYHHHHWLDAWHTECRPPVALAEAVLLPWLGRGILPACY